MTLFGEKRAQQLKPSVLVDFPARETLTLNHGPISTDHEIRLLTIYRSNSGVVGCDCPRVVKTNGELLVWHSPECEYAGA